MQNLFTACSFGKLCLFAVVLLLTLPVNAEHKLTHVGFYRINRFITVKSVDVDGHNTDARNV